MIKASYYIFKTEEKEYLKPIQPLKDSGCQKLPENLPAYWGKLYSFLNVFFQEKAVTHKFPEGFHPEILIGFASMGSLCEEEPYDNIYFLPGRKPAGKTLSDAQPPLRTKKQAGKGFPASPLITFGLENIMTDDEEENVTTGSLSAKYFALDKRYGFWDSSIWHRYVPLVDGWKMAFEQLVDEILLNYQRGLYHTMVAHEYLELQARLIKQNYFLQEGHGKGVTPFSYGSESVMKKKADELWREIHRLQPNIRWNCFLVDDYANKPLRPLPNLRTDIQALKKGQLIKEISNQPPKGERNRTFLTISNLAKENKDKEDKWTVGDLISDLTAEAGKEKIYDIIFLDYYLGEFPEEEKQNSYDYGYRLLEEIVQSKKNNTLLVKRANPLGKFWIFPISAFPFAFKSHVSARGDENFTQYWNLSDGGNPINSPHHFRMKLYKLLLTQLNDVSIDSKDITYMLDLIAGTDSENNTKQDIRRRARENYNYFTQLLANFYRVSREYNPDGKGFMETRNIREDALLLTHLEQFIRLLAFAPSQDDYKMEEKLGVLLRVLDRRQLIAGEKKQEWEKLNEYLLNINDKV